MKTIQSIQRALDIIECFDEQNKELSLSEINSKLSLNKSTAHGILNTLSNNGYITQNKENGKYLLGYKLIIKGNLASGSINEYLKDCGLKYIKELSEKFKVTTHLFSHNLHKLLLVKMNIPNKHYCIISSVVGAMPLNATASGKIVLSTMSKKDFDNYLEKDGLTKFTKKTITKKDLLINELENIKKQQYALEDEEVEEGVSSISVPIYDNNKDLIATISLTDTKEKVDNIIDEVVEVMKDYSKKISKEIYK